MSVTSDFALCVTLLTSPCPAYSLNSAADYLGREQSYSSLLFSQREQHRQICTQRLEQSRTAQPLSCTWGEMWIMDESVTWKPGSQETQWTLGILKAPGKRSQKLDLG